ncbi:DUF262 domain-containing HNH endonuclease family protein [Prevotella sp. LMAG:51]|uniref:DUF262 domain-containing protein n=1 Tax=Prevotella sp. LMAG:51 TaxID=1969564 RepID=UPI00257B8D3B|nr:DUF262 domain-containing HNH endonuclease family protein [Prevotella sp. LMAG:51]
MPTKNIEPNLRLISEYTRLEPEDKFCIPEYQRGYSWTTVQCEKLWQDIGAFLESGAEDPYFFGTIIIDCSKDNCLSLIDGQQRTTTFLLLLKAISLCIKKSLRVMPESDDTRALRRGLNNSYEKIFRILYKADEDKFEDIERDWNNAKGIVVLENRSINELYKNDFQAIIEAANFNIAENSVYKIPRKQKDNKYTNFFRNFKYFYNNLSSYSESQLNNFAKIFLSKCQIIEIKSWQIEQAITMFNSLNSTGMPLSDADIISAQLYSKADNKDLFIEQWQRINEKAEILCQKKVVSIDAVLQQFMYYERATKQQYKIGEVTTPGVRKYYTYENPELLNEPYKLSDAFEKILNIWNIIADYPIIQLLLKFNENFKLFLLPYLYRFEANRITEEKIKPIVECFLRLFAIMEMGEVGYSASVFKTFLFTENLNLVNPDYTEESIIADFDRHITASFNEDDIIVDLKDYDKNILVFLNEYLYAQNKGIPFKFESNVNVEHIMPASGHNVDTIRIDAGIGTREEFDNLVNKLGNKILLEENINKSVSNDWFKTKKGTTVQSKQGYLGSEFGLAIALAHYPKDKWKKSDIKQFTEDAAQRIANFIFHK